VTSKHFANYYKEYRDQELIETDYGMVTYVLQPENSSIFIQDLYVVPEQRKQHRASDLVDMVCEIGRKEGMTLMVSVVFMAYRYKEVSLLASLMYGCKIVAADSIKIVLSKEL
jgi:hypothetical protein